MEPSTAATVRDLMVDVVNNGTGTRAQIPGVQVAGKTGTAQVAGKGDTSLFAAMWPATAPRYVVVVVVEQAGFGSQTAAPIARRIIEQMNHLPTPPVEVIDEGHD